MKSVVVVVRAVARVARAAAVAVLPAVVAVAAACAPAASPRDDAASTAAAGSGDACSALARMPDDKARVRAVGADGVVVDVPGGCDRAGCLRTRADTIAVADRAGGVWVTNARHPAGMRIADDVALGSIEDPADADDVRWARAMLQAQRGRTPAPAAGATTTGPAPPELDDEFRTCGMTEAGNGRGWHVIRNADNVWQRIAWIDPPMLDDVKALTLDAYPIARSDGHLCAWGTQRAPRMWQIHVVATGDVVDAAPDREHAPARCEADGSVLIETSTDDGIRIGHDGRRTPVPRAQREMQTVRALDVRGAASIIVAPKTGLPIHRADGRLQTLPLDEAHELDGSVLPRGTVRERVTGVGDGATRMLLVERLRLPDCVVRERAFVVALDGGAARRVVDDDVVVARPSYALGRFVWVEAKPRYVDVGASTD